MVCEARAALACLHSGRNVLGFSVQSATLTSTGSSMVFSSRASILASGHCSACGLAALHVMCEFPSVCGERCFHVCIKQLRVQTAIHCRLSVLCTNAGRDSFCIGFMDMLLKQVRFNKYNSPCSRRRYVKH